METKAKAKFIKISFKKVRLVAGLIRGLGVEEALTRLTFANKVAAKPVMKLLRSAISNAQENYNLEENNLFVKEIRVDEGPVLKRWTPRAMGRATPIRKRSSHIILVLAEKNPTDEKLIKKSSKKEVVDNIVKVNDINELKDKFVKEDGRRQSGDKKDVSVVKNKQKRFINKVFNRKSGDK